MRLKLVPQETNWDFFKRNKLTLGLSVLLILVGFASFMLQGLNYGIDFRGGTTYDVGSGLLWELHGVERDELLPIELADWIELATPFNSDPVRPR